MLHCFFDRAALRDFLGFWRGLSLLQGRVLQFPLFFLTMLLVWDGEKLLRTEDQWREILGRDRYFVMRKKGSERAFLGQYVFTQESGIYLCAACELPLFSSQDKYDSGSGWPSFTQPVSSKNVYFLEDWRMAFKRYEVLCSRCDSHLGHVFNDGPKPKGLRYCINSISINLETEQKE